MAIMDQIKETLQNVAQTTGEKFDIAKLSIDIKSAEEKQRGIQIDIGKKVYEGYLAGEELDNDTIEMCVKIEEIEKEINSMNDKILKLKNKKKCIECDATLQLSDKFCNTCGARQPEIAEETLDFSDAIEVEETETDNEEDSNI